MNVLFAGQVPKEHNFPDDIEDVFEIDTEDNRIVISDGASESFDSRTWARVLAAAFLKRPQMNEGWLADAIAEYKASFDFVALSWSKQAAFARGSFATLLAIAQTERDAVKVFSVGDSLAVFLDNGETVETFPYTQPEEFEQRPKLLCTNSEANAFVTSPEFLSNQERAWTLQGRTEPIILCMTDALGEWAMRHWLAGEPKWQQLALIRDINELETLVLQERESKALRVDDTTLLILSFAKREKDELPDS